MFIIMIVDMEMFANADMDTDTDTDTEANTDRHMDIDPWVWYITEIGFERYDTFFRTVGCNDIPQKFG